MEIKITIPNNKKDAIIEAFAIQYNYQEELEDANGNMIPNPQSKKVFTANIIKSFIREIYKAVKIKEVNTAIQKARDDADNFTNDITLT